MAAARSAEYLSTVQLTLFADFYGLSIAAGLIDRLMLMTFPVTLGGASTSLREAERQRRMAEGGW